jgi:hypothetical protein
VNKFLLSVALWCSNGSPRAFWTKADSKPDFGVRSMDLLAPNIPIADPHFHQRLSRIAFTAAMAQAQAEANKEAQKAGIVHAGRAALRREREELPVYETPDPRNETEMPAKSLLDFVN